jgi:competence/damage-inducible protein CinA-like protein
MTAAILSIGTELTRGEIDNTNAGWLANELTNIGFDVTEITAVDDDPDRVVAALARLCQAHAVVIATGGLGPTTDDLTAAAVARAKGVGLVRHEGALENIRRRFEALKRDMPASNQKQADVPEGSEVLLNPVGTAPGFAVALGGAKAFFLPGVPHEMRRLFEDYVAPRIGPSAPNLIFQARLKTYGLPESAVAEKLADFDWQSAGVTLGYRASFPEVEVKVYARADTPTEARDRASRAVSEVRARLGEIVYGEGDDTFPDVVARALRARGFKLAVAESCSGGLVGHLLTREPASDYFVADAVTYANAAKTALVGVSEDMLRGHGAVSAEVAAAMAEGVRRVCGAEIGLSLTGVAGPSGATPEKPVGLVFWAVAYAGPTVVRSRIFPGERHHVQRGAAFAGLSLVRDVCLGRVA